MLKVILVNCICIFPNTWLTVASLTGIIVDVCVHMPTRLHLP